MNKRLKLKIGKIGKMRLKTGVRAGTTVIGGSNIFAV